MRKEEFDETKPESVWISEQIGRKVIKSFNSVLVYSLQNLGKTKMKKIRSLFKLQEMMKNKKKLS